MGLEERIENEIKLGMKARDAIKVSTLRMLKADIYNIKLKKNKTGLTEEEVIKAVQTQVKRHKDSIEQFKKGNRQDLVDKETKELDILLAYMPAGLSPEELKKIVEDVIKETGAVTMKDMGKVMKAAMEKVKGRADGNEVSRVVSGLLG